MSFRPRAVSSPILLVALCLGAPLAAQADCEGRVGALMPATPVAGTENLSPALAELIAHHRGDFGPAEVSTSRRSAPSADPEPTVAVLGTRVAVVAPLATAVPAVPAR